MSKKWILIGGVAIVVLGVILVLLLSGGKKPPDLSGANQWKPAQVPPQSWVLNKPGVWVMTVTSLDTVTWSPTSYKIWADRPYRAAVYPSGSGGQRREYSMPAAPKYYHGAPGLIDHLEVMAIDTLTVFWAQRVM
ncbi:MAG: hypothetical protein V1696_00355 [Candidatus Jorgensenbacteria bacterium]